MIVEEVLQKENYGFRQGFIGRLSLPELADLLESGVKPEDVAERAGVSTGTFYNHLARNGYGLGRRSIWSLVPVTIVELGKQ